MSESKRRAPGAPIRQRRSLVIRREDHIGDPIGIAFLESAETDGDAVLDRLREYLGSKLKLIKAEVSHDEIAVEVESRGWSEEGARMAAAASDLYAKGARRGALLMYRDAVQLDPLNSVALLRLGLALTEVEKFAEAFIALKRAREFGADSGSELLIAMARCAARLGRPATALAYYEQVLKLEPRNFVARSALRALGRARAAEKKAPGAVRTVPD
jgi:tetratricopeptide (TPR) repeat protein